MCYYYEHLSFFDKQFANDIEPMVTLFECFFMWGDENHNKGIH
jgi:hypothetical protein